MLFIAMIYNEKIHYLLSIINWIVLSSYCIASFMYGLVFIIIFSYVPNQNCYISLHIMFWLIWIIFLSLLIFRINLKNNIQNNIQNNILDKNHKGILRFNVINIINIVIFIVSAIFTLIYERNDLPIRNV